MGQTPKKRLPPPIYLGEWLVALGVKPADLARETGVNEGYISSLVNKTKRNPTPTYLARIAEYLGIPWQQLYERPPDAELLDRISRLDPTVLDRLARQKRQ